MRLNNKQVLVTAAGQGMGRAAAVAMAEQGAQVLATDVRAELLDSLKGVPNVRTAVLDVTRKADVQSVVGSMSKIDVLFNCAGFVHHGTILDATDEQWDFGFSLNVRSQFWAIQAALPIMLKGGGGSIINMASV